MADDVGIEIDTGRQREGLIAVQVERQVGYGSVVGLEDEELADPAELERQVMLAEWGPVLAIPVRWDRPVIRPNIDEDGELDWGAFGTVDFYRLKPPFISAFRLARELKKDLRHAVIMLSLAGERLPDKDRAEVLNRTQQDRVDLDYFDDFNRWSCARWYLRARTLRRRIRGLRRAGHEAWLRERDA